MYQGGHSHETNEPNNISNPRLSNSVLMCIRYYKSYCIEEYTGTWRRTDPPHDSSARHSSLQHLWFPLILLLYPLPVPNLPGWLRKALDQENFSSAFHLRHNTHQLATLPLHVSNTPNTPSSRALILRLLSPLPIPLPLPHRHPSS